jgi:hypothetical protein
MQRRSSKFLLILLTFVIFFSTVAAAPFQNKSLTLLEVRFIKGVGIVLLFDSTGLTKKDLKGGTVDVHSGLYKMSCEFKDDTEVVRCVIKGSLVQYAGENFSGELAGFAFFGMIPELKEPKEFACSDEESLWYVVNVYGDGEPYSIDVPAEIYDFLVEWITEWSEGTMTLEIADTYCGEKIILEESEGPQ